MAYTWNTDRTGGVGITSKITQKGIDEFPLMYANDLDWADVEIESGVTLKKTDDLLDYIKGANSSIIGRIDEVELANAGYEVRCEKSVCYVGDVLYRVPVQIYKNGTLLTWANITAEGITLKSPITKPTGANDLIQFTSNGQWLNGTVNKHGTYIFEFVKNGVNIASHRLLVLKPAYKSALVMAYVKSQTMPLTPTGGEYDFDNDVLTTPPTSTNPSLTWSASSDNLNGTGPVWFSAGSVNEEDPTAILWNEPCILLTEEIVAQEADHRIKEIAIYKAVKSTASAPSAPSGANVGSYSFSANNGNGSFTCPTGWSLEPNAAVIAYKSSAATADQDNYKIWKSYNSYQCTVSTDTPPVYGTVTESGWTTPVVYLDIDGILADADARALDAFTTALGNASSDLQLAAQLIQNTQPLIDAVNAIFAWRIVGNSSDTLDSKYTELEDTSGVDTTMDSLHALFDGYYNSTNSRYEGTIAALNSNANICIPSMEFKAIAFGSITDLNGTEPITTGKWVAYIPTTTEIRTQIASLSDDLSQLNTTVNQQTPEWIRLQASEGFLDNVTWTMVPEAEYTSATNKIDLGSAALPTTEYVASTNTSGYRYGYYYKRTESGVNYWYRCDYPISTGFANILADRVSFGVTNNLSGSDSVKGALIDMTVDGVSITGDKIVLNGDAIADAIYGKSLNISNRTYLNNDGSVIFNADKASTRFNVNGSGQLAGGNISWTGNGSVYMHAAYIGDFGDGHNWTIKTLSDSSNLPVIYAKDTSGTATNNQELYITPQYLRSCNSTTSSNPLNDDWRISRDGSAVFAGRRARFMADGSFHLGGNANTQTTSGKKDGYIDYDPSSGQLSIVGDNISIDAGVTASIGTSLAGNSNFIGVVADAASGSVTINGMLNTQDIDVGNGASYFSTGHDTKVYHGHTYNSTTSGAGHLANGNIWWDKEGNLSIGGKVNLKGTSLEWGGSVQQYELTPTDFSTTYGISSKQGTFRSKGAIYSLPDPAEYLGREVFVEVYITGLSIRTILNDDSYLSSGSAILKMPCFEIDSDNWKHKWIKWGVDACKYTTSDINHLPKFYLLGSPFMYNGNDGRDENEESGLAQYHTITVDNTQNSRANMANDFFWGFSQMTSGVLSAGLSDSGSNRYGRKGGLYLVPNAHKCQQMFDCKTGSSHDNDQIILRMRCLAKKIRNSGDDNNAWYYWEIQTTDFIPFFDNMPFDPNSGSTISADYVDGSRNGDLTASSFYDVYEKAFASSLLAFDDNFNVVTMNSDNINNGGLLTNMS